MSAVAEPGLLDRPFVAAMTTAAVAQMRGSLEVSTNPNLLALYGFAALDRDGMVAMLQSVVAEDGEDEAMRVLGVLADLKDNLDRVARMAEMVEARALVAMHVAFGVTTEETMSGPDADDHAAEAWAKALGEVERHLARYEALPDPYTDEAANEIAADLGPALDTLVGTPPPDLPALLRKFEILWGAEDDFTRHPDAMDVRMVAKDIRRLSEAAE